MRVSDWLAPPVKDRRSRSEFTEGIAVLVLSRRVGASILIGDNVRIVVTKVSGNRVTFGIEAPEHVRILRSELEAATVSVSQDVVPQTVLDQTMAVS